MGSIAEPLPSKPINLAIIGGGLAGLALTIGIQSVSPNINVTIYESAPAFAEIGVGVAFGPNVVRAMRLISPDIVTGFKKHATGNSKLYPKLHDIWASFRYGMDGKDSAGNERKYGDLISHLEGTKHSKREEGMGVRTCVHRARFLEQLVALIPEGTARFGKRLTEIQKLDDGQLRLSFADGETVLADAVVGCDGIKSVTRPFVFGAEGASSIPRFTGEYAYRALVPIAVARATLGDERALNAQLYCGYGGYIMSYPVEHGEFANIAATKVKGDLVWDEENWVVPSTSEDMVGDFAGWGDDIVELLRRFETKDKWGFFDMAHTHSYYRERVCLLGDSAHASGPHLGAGAGSCFEDAYVLSNLLGMARGVQDVDKVFDCYDGARRERTQDVVRLSRRAGKANCFVAEGIEDDFGKLKADIEERYRWVWDMDLEAELKMTKAKLVLL